MLFRSRRSLLGPKKGSKPGGFLATFSALPVKKIADLVAPVIFFIFIGLGYPNKNFLIYLLTFF